MTPAFFALAAAALLVCARADASSDIVDMIFPDFGQDRTFNTENDSKILRNVPNDRPDIAHDSLTLRRSKIPKYYHENADYTENDRGIQQIVPNYRRDKSYDDTEIDSEIPNDRQDKADDSLKTRWRIVKLKDHQDKAYDTESDSEIHQVVPNDRQDQSYHDSQKTGQMIIPNDKQKEANNTESDSEVHQVVPDGRQHKVYYSQKTRRKIITNPKTQDIPYDTESDRAIQQFVTNDPQAKGNDTKNDEGIQQIVSVDRQDVSYDTETGSEMHELLTNGRQGKAYYETKENCRTQIPDDRQDKAYPSGKKTELPSACLYDGRWHSDGAAVSTREDCLRCVCAGGALSCRRRACAPLPDPLPPRCHVRHRRGVCCPELHCPNGVQLMEHEASARTESMGGPTDAEVPTATPATAKNACVEGGSVFAAGSAMASRVACEQCFCLRGARHCVRPSCLPPPPHCAPRPSPGACCPQRYYCDTTTDRPNQHSNRYDCQVGNALVKEGAPVESRSNCSVCFCLRGEVRCQALGCAPALAGCRPLLARGDCCAHQYVCDHDEPAGNHDESDGNHDKPAGNHEKPAVYHDEPAGNHDEPVGNDDRPGTQSNVIAATGSSPTSTRHDERTLHSAKSGKLESTTKKILTSLYTLKHSSFASATKNHLITTTKVKRKTDEPPLNASIKPEQNTNTTSNNITITQKPISAAKLIAMPEFSQSFEISPEKTTEQPEGTVKIVINGTINCTAELSSTSLPLSITVNDTDKQMEALPRVPIVNVEAQTYSPNDIITDRNVNGGFDEDDTFTINVTSSLMTNTSQSTSKPVMTGAKIPIPTDLAEALNSSKKKKGEYDYDYTEPTLPPSLPNLKIIPFVAADAVVDDEPTKETLTYPILEREDKFPVYYPSATTKDSKFPVRREDAYQPTQYPVFVLGKVDPSYVSHEVDVARDRYPERNDPGIHEYTVSTSLGSQGSDVKTVTQVPLTSTTFAVDTPAVNLFSPPEETEGGFLPKGSGVIDEYFGVYPSTPSGPAVPQLTTSMQLDVIKDVQGECLVDGQQVPGGQSIVLGCQLCTCSWVELTCERRPCAPVAPPCRRLPLTNHSRDPCCGDVDCAPEKNATSGNATVVQENKENGTKVEGTSTTSEPLAVVPFTGNTDTVDSNASHIGTVTLNDVTTPPSVNNSVQKITTTAVPVEAAAVDFVKLIVTSSAKPTPKLTSTTTTPTPVKQVDDTSSEEDEDDDGSFSFGSVLKLLLSDYETTTAPSKKPSSRTPTRSPPTAPPVRSPSTSAPYTSRPAEETFFKPLPPRSYVIPLIQPNTVNRIDHLVLGEATAIKRTTHRPITNNTTKRPTSQTYERPIPQTYERPTPQTYQRPTPPTYERPTPQTYERPTPQTYQRPTPQTYERPTPQTYERPTPQTYERPTPQTYQRPIPQTYERPTPQPYERPKPLTHEGPTQQTYERPIPQTHEGLTPQTYERPTPQTYERPTPQTYERPTPQTYERPTPQTHEGPTPQTYERLTPQTYERPTPETHDSTERRPVMQEDAGLFTLEASGGPRPPSLGNLPGVGSGLLKLAGCNIYGRMYRVGRIITELSTPCTECWCTELGVQCKPLDC